MKDTAIRKNWAAAPVCPTRISCWLPLEAPISGRMPMVSEISNAPINATCPSSGIIVYPLFLTFGITCARILPVRRRLPAACNFHRAWPALPSLRTALESSSAPRAITPWPSRNRSGSVPTYSTVTSSGPSVTTNWVVRPSPCRSTLPGLTSPPSRNCRPGRHRLLSQFAGTLEIQQIFLQRVESDCAGDADTGQDQQYGNESSFTCWCHGNVPLFEPGV